MKTLLSGLMAAALAASFAVPLPTEAQAAPVYVPTAPSPAAEQGRPEVQKAAHTYRHWKRQQRRAERRAWRRHVWRDRYRDPYYYRGGYGFAPRYRYYNRYPRYYRRPGVTLEFNF